MSHTEGKLTARGDLVCNSSGNGLWDYDKGQAENEANTRRLVACWNALDGVPTEWLEKYVGIGAKNIIQQNTDLIRKEEELTEKLIAAEEENDGLRKAAEEVYDLFVCGHTSNELMQSAMKDLRAELNK